MEPKEPIDIDELEGGEPESDEEQAADAIPEEGKATDNSIPSGASESKQGGDVAPVKSNDDAAAHQEDEETKEVAESSSDDDCDADVPDEETHSLPVAPAKKAYTPAPGELCVEMLDFDAAKGMEQDKAAVYLDAIDVLKTLIEMYQREDWELKKEKKGHKI